MPPRIEQDSSGGAGGGQIISYPGGDPPVLVSATAAKGDTLGYQTVVLAGDKFTGALAVYFGATPADWWRFDNDDQITAVAPPHAAGNVSITVVGPGGTSGGVTYEYWSPAVEAPSIFFEGAFVTSITGLLGTWTARSNVVAVPATVDQVGVATPDSQGGSPDFERANSDRLTNENVGNNPISDYTGFGDTTALWTGLVESITAQGALVYNNDPLYTDRSGYGGLMLGGAGKNKGVYWQYDTAVRSVTVTIGVDPVTGSITLGARKKSGTVQITPDGVTWTVGDACGALNAGAAVGTALWIGAAFYDNTKYYDGVMQALVIDDTGWSDVLVAKYFTWSGSRFATGTAWNPAIQALSGMWRDYSLGLFTGLVSRGDSGSRDLTEATNPPAVATLNGRGVANYDGANDILVADGVAPDYVAVGSTRFTFSCLLKATAGPDAAFLGDAGGNVYLYVYSSNGDGTGDLYIEFQCFDTGVFKLATAAVADGWSLGSWHDISFGCNGSDYWIQIDGNPVVIGDAAIAGCGMDDDLVFGHGAFVGGYFLGQQADVLITDSYVTPTNLANNLAYFNRRYALTL